MSLAPFPARERGVRFTVSQTFMAVPHVLRSFTFLGWTLQAALDLPAANEARRRQVAELWCGVGSIWRAGAEMGYEAIGYDKARLPGVTDSEGPLCEDITTPSGF